MAGRIRVLPAEVTFEVADGESVFQAAVRNRVRWPSVCNGDCECGTCWMVVESGAEALSPRSGEEVDRLAAGVKAREPRARLACRARLNGEVGGEVTATRRGVRPLD